MKTSTKVLSITLVCAVLAFVLGNVLWPATEDMAPSAAQLPFFIAIAVLEAVAFGLGVSFLVLGWSRAGDIRPVFIAVAWLLVSWWPHDNMHKHNGLDMAGLLKIEYLFHVTLIIAGIIIARYLWKQLSAAPQLG